MATATNLWRRGDAQPRTGTDVLFIAAVPVAAVGTGLALAFLDFRALREPILLVMVLAVAITAYEVSRHAPVRRQFLTAAVLGPAAWAAAQVVYVAVQLLRQEPFEADRFGPQWAQAVGLIAAHALFLGVPTGLAAGALLAVWRWFVARGST